MLKFSLTVLLLLSVTQGRDITFIKDGVEQDVGKQLAEGNLVIEDEITKIDTELSEVETEVLDTSVFAGANTNQVYDPDRVVEEDVSVEVISDKERQLIEISANETDTDIDIDIDREDRESVDVDFDVDHDGESYRVTYDEDGNEIREQYRIDDQELNVYVDEYTGDDFEYETTNDDIEIEVYVDIDDQDIDLEDYIDFDIGLWGERDDSANDDIFISGRYQSEARDKKKTPNEVQEYPQDEGATDEYPTDEYEFGELRASLICSDGIDVSVPEYDVVKYGKQYTQICRVPADVRAQVLQYEWVKVDIETGEEKVVSSDSELNINSASCKKNAAVYKCRVTYICDSDVGYSTTTTAESSELTLMVDRGYVSNPICQIFGDPHIITFDQKIYSFQGECTYLLAMDAAQGSWFVYGKFTQCGNNGTCIESVTVYTASYAVELMRGWVINQNGRKLPVKEGKTLYPDETMSLYFDGYEVFLEIREPQIQLTWDGIMNLKIEVSSRATTLGLCGNNNADPDDDFLSYYGNLLDDPTEFGHLQAVDRHGHCKKPPAKVEMEGDVDAARAECEQVLQSGLFEYTSDYLERQATRRGSAHELYRSDKLIDMCIYDVMANMGVEELTAQCYAGYNYVSIVKRLGICIPEGWQRTVGCVNKEELQDITIRQGCPWGETPLPFNRD